MLCEGSYDPLKEASVCGRTTVWVSACGRFQVPPST
jgi:hypothetical protein